MPLHGNIYTKKWLVEKMIWVFGNFVCLKEKKYQ